MSDLQRERVAEQLWESIEDALDRDQEYAVNQVPEADEWIADWVRGNPSLFLQFVIDKRKDLADRLFDLKINKALYGGPEYDSEGDM